MVFCLGNGERMGIPDAVVRDFQRKKNDRISVAFIHRLVNDKDLFLINNSISTLDNLSKDMIPNLGTGCCVVTGTSFDLPLVMQVDRLNIKFRPNSEDVDLEKLWCD